MTDNCNNCSSFWKDYMRNPRITYYCTTCHEITDAEETNDINASQIHGNSTNTKKNDNNTSKETITENHDGRKNQQEDL